MKMYRSQLAFLITKSNKQTNKTKQKTNQNKKKEKKKKNHLFGYEV